MIFQKTEISDLWLITPELLEDERGFFTRIFCRDEFAKHNIKFNNIQSNLTLTREKGAIRGMHFQKEPMAEDKIVQCIKGEIFDVAVDLRKKSRTFLKWVSVELNENNKKMFYIPKGFAHGFQTLTENCELLYFMSEYFSPEHSCGYRWDDPSFNISWPLKNLKLSDKDSKWDLVKKYEKKR